MASAVRTSIALNGCHEYSEKTANELRLVALLCNDWPRLTSITVRGIKVIAWQFYVEYVFQPKLEKSATFLHSNLHMCNWWVHSVLGSCIYQCLQLWMLFGILINEAAIQKTLKGFPATIPNWAVAYSKAHTDGGRGGCRERVEQTANKLEKRRTHFVLLAAAICKILYRVSLFSFFFFSFFFIYFGPAFA